MDIDNFYDGDDEPEGQGMTNNGTFISLCKHPLSHVYVSRL